MAEPECGQGDRTSTRLELVLATDATSAELAESRVVAFCLGAGFDEPQCHEIGLAVREAVANAVIHGNRRDAAKKVLLAAELRKDCLAVSVEDEGAGFQLEAVSDPLVPGQLLKDSGRGIFLVKACMDEVSARQSNSGGTTLAMLKYFKKLPKGEQG